MTARRPHVVVVHRWRESYALYTDAVDHGTHAVTYVTTEVGRAGVPSAAAEVVVVDRTDDWSVVAPVVDGLVARWGRPAGVVALKEDDLLVGAALRARHGVPGPRVEELVPFRDKHEMCRRVAAAGVDVPAAALVRTADDVLRHAAEHGWPLVLKPVSGSSSEGVVRLDGPADLLDVVLGAPRVVQPFVDAPIYHVDGVFDGTDVVVLRASAYLNDCLAFRAGAGLGSVEEDDPALVAAIRRSAVASLAALTDRPTVFHLELFVDVATRRCRFLEVGARVGGAEVPLVWREVHGVDLMAVALDLQLGRPLRALPDAAAGEEVAGWLLVPAPARRPCRITRSRSMVGAVPGPYAERVLGVGDVLPDADAYYEHVGGRFRFRGRSRAEVEAAVRATLADFEVRGEAIDAHVPEPWAGVDTRVGPGVVPATPVAGAVLPA